MIKILDTLTGVKKPLPEDREIKLFVCGPTVYDYAHIGNARTFITFDIFARYLRSRGFKVYYLQNITDIDDKILSRAHEKNTTVKDLARFFEQAYRRNMKELGVISVTRYARATDYIPEIVRQVKTLIKKGNAYKIEGDGYYFDLSSFADYGKLAKRTREQAEDAVSRIDEGVGKRNKGDFCLWKFPKTRIGADNDAERRRRRFAIIGGEPAWNTELGWGRPGWHIEDTAITERHFGPQYDIHGGGQDLIFPHHEAEIAQQESASGLTPFVNVWMHAAFLLIEGRKMSKSLHNFITIPELLTQCTPEAFRMIVLNHHYRSPVDYSLEAVKWAEASLNTVREFLGKLEMVQKARGRAFVSGKGEQIEDCIRQFYAAMDDDFSTPKALSSLFDLLSAYQTKVWTLAPASAKKMADFIRSAFGSFGIKLSPQRIPSGVNRLAVKREKARGDQKFIEADRFRKQIEELEYEVEDTPIGPYIKNKIQISKSK